MKFCPQCNLEFEDETVFCPRDGSQLQARVAKVGVMKLGSRPASAGVLGTGALTGAAAAPAGAPSGVPSMATQQEATMRAPRVATRSLRAPTPGRGEAPTYQNTVRASSGAQQAARAFLQEPDSDATSRVMLPDHGPTVRPLPDGASDMLDTPTVAMAASPVATMPEAAAPTDPPPPEGDEDLSGRSIAARYKLLKKLGEGGMGVVYAAVDERIEKQVAIKILREEFARRPDVVARFTQEARSAGRIKHENVLDVTDYGRTEDNSFYIAMELLVGTDLADVLTKETTLPPERGIDIAIQICRALAAAHREGVVHRDLKPENVFLVRSADNREVVKIVDFGIAQLKDASGDSGRKLTRTGMIFGTPEYMSPEQAAGKPIDNRVDVYATGVILFEMFAGRVPFVGDTFMGVLTQHMFEPVPSLRQVYAACVVNDDLEAVIAKALAKDPAQRYVSMTELAEDLQRVRSGLKPNAPSGYEGTGTFLRSQMLSGAGITPGAIQPSRPGAAPTGAVAAGVARTIEGELSPPRRSIALAVGVGLGLLGVAVAVAVSLAQPDPVPPPARQPDPPRVPMVTPSPTPTPVPPPVTDAGAAAAPTTVQLNVSTPGASSEVRVPGEATPRCTSTPCVVSAPRGAQLTLLATNGSRTATATVQATTDGQPVVITLPQERVERPDRYGHVRTPPRPTEVAPPPTTRPHSGSSRRCSGPTDCGCENASGLLVPCL
jgi:serine/threonine-protein kinase